MKIKRFQFFPYHIAPLEPHPRTGAPGPQGAEDAMNAFLAGRVRVGSARVAVGGHPDSPLIIVVFLHEDAAPDEPRRTVPRAKLFLAYPHEGREREIPGPVDAFLDGTASVTDIQVAALAGTVEAVLATLVRYEGPA